MPSFSHPLSREDLEKEKPMKKPTKKPAKPKGSKKGC